MKNPNLDILIAAVRRLGSIADEMVFVGGCATGLLLTDPAAPSIRVTEDVDAIVEVTTLAVAAVPFELYSGKLIRMVTAPYFLATKLEAFDGRGNEDYLVSHDIEDIVALMDGRSEIVEEVTHSRDDLKSYLAHRFADLLEHHRFIDALPGHLSPDMASQSRLPMIINRIRQIGGFKS